MGRRGPAPEPTALREARGARDLPGREGEPRPTVKAPPCPKWLDSDARKVWRQVVPKLVKLGVMTEIDGGAMARYCDLFVRWRKCAEFVRQYGESYPTKSPDGTVTSLQQFPEVGIMNRLGPQLLKLEQEFGLTPASRTTIKVDAVPAGPPGATDILSMMRASKQAAS